MALETVPLSAILGIGGSTLAGTTCGRGLLGPYRLLDRVGIGAYAAVYRARHELMGVERAVKVLRPRPSDGRGQRERFLHEARIAARLRHPDVVSVHDCGIAADGTPYIVMEYVAGRSLADLLRDGMPPPGETLRVARRVAAALDHAHALGVVHRDVKPANVLLGDDGAVQLTDFGIAQAGREFEWWAPWAGLGTPAYMAPEQRLGQRAGVHTDVYALAVVLYEMLTGQIPDEDGGPSPRAINPYLPAAVDRAVSHGLAQDPARRPPSAGQLVAALDAALCGPASVTRLPRRLRFRFGRGAG
jgi:serine/threonine-protein kinase